jgi:NADH-quinone oxidoreductase subunit J
VSDAFLFWVIGGLTAACAVATVVTHNIVRAATWLLFTLAGTSGLFFLIGADLVGAVQLLVYVGGTLVLVVFGVMLTAQGPFITMRTSSAEWAVSVTVGITMFALLVLALTGTSKKLNPQGPTAPNVAFAPPIADDVSPKRSPYTMVIGEGFAGVPVGPAHLDPSYRPELKRKDEPPPEKDAKPSPAGIVRMNYLLPFEIVSVHLLVVLIGAAYLARAKRREEQQGGQP